MNIVVNATMVTSNAMMEISSPIVFVSHLDRGVNQKMHLSPSNPRIPSRLAKQVKALRLISRHALAYGLARLRIDADFSVCSPTALSCLSQPRFHTREQCNGSC